MALTLRPVHRCLGERPMPHSGSHGFIFVRPAFDRTLLKHCHDMLVRYFMVLGA